MRFEGMSGRVGKLEAEIYGGRIATTDGTGRRVWLAGCGLRTAFQILKIQDNSGEENLSHNALPPALREEVFLWSRAETEGQGQAAAMVKKMCIQIMGRRPES
jgi:hypothetical protein